MPSRSKGRRHPDIGDDHLRVGLFRRGNQLVVVGGHPDYLEIGFQREQGPDALAHEDVVIGQRPP